ncbi:hypothetical protein MJT46_017351 [Ovis ammon polii x Ovis aries]|nr:hypothetical protein MJT46_017351 [Ovis ammon polii x Ovis aries]
MTWRLLLRKRHFRKMVVPASTSSQLKLTRIRLAGIRTKSSRRNPQLSEQLPQSKRKGSAEAPRKMLEGSPTQPPDAQWWSPGQSGPETGTVCFKVKSETRYSARFGSSFTKMKRGNGSQVEWYILQIHLTPKFKVMSSKSLYKKRSKRWLH